jgi:hypothetical protein
MIADAETLDEWHDTRPQRIYIKVAGWFPTLFTREHMRAMLVHELGDMCAVEEAPRCAKTLAKLQGHEQFVLQNLEDTPAPSVRGAKSYMYDDVGRDDEERAANAAFQAELFIVNLAKMLRPHQKRILWAKLYSINSIGGYNVYFDYRLEGDA